MVSAAPVRFLEKRCSICCTEVTTGLLTGADESFICCDHPDVTAMSKVAASAMCFIILPKRHLKSIRQPHSTTRTEVACDAPLLIALEADYHSLRQVYRLGRIGKCIETLLRSLCRVGHQVHDP